MGLDTSNSACDHTAHSQDRDEVLEEAISFRERRFKLLLPDPIT